MFARLHTCNGNTGEHCSPLHTNQNKNIQFTENQRGECWLLSILEIKHLTKTYKNGRGIRNVSLTAERGDAVGLLGPNGSGKTTTMKTVLGLCHASGGSIRVFERDMTEYFEENMARIGALIEAPAIYGEMTARKNLELAARFYPNADAARIDKVLEIVRLSEYKKDKVARFSLGMKQRLGLAIAILSEPELVFLDEPANGIDIEGMIEIREIIAAMREEYGTTFIISSHLSSEIEKTCNKVAIMHEGELIATAETAELLRGRVSLEEYYLNMVKNRRGEIVL